MDIEEKEELEMPEEELDDALDDEDADFGSIDPDALLADDDIDDTLDDEEVVGLGIGLGVEDDEDDEEEDDESVDFDLYDDIDE